MALRFIIVLGISLTFILTVIHPGLAQEPPHQSTPPASTPEILPGEIIVKFQADVGRLGAQNSLRAEGLRPLEVRPKPAAVR
ncbi:MAG: hypothetical protein HC875_37775, partial [Anaerolineales bacterium]|nr:hypothetical protein [Anaerolineales bacterium]